MNEGELGLGIPWNVQLRDHLLRWPISRKNFRGEETDRTFSRRKEYPYNENNLPLHSAVRPLPLVALGSQVVILAKNMIDDVVEVWKRNFRFIM